MTIKEIEEKTGMTRANIRYYEREGLLSPSRADNNYRDYSEGDLAALQKIRLLRQLHVPVGEIVRLQRGETSLDAVLAAQSASLRGEIDELKGAAALCQELRESRVSYDELDAAYYLNRAAEPVGGTRWKPLTYDVLPVAPHPWKRLFAREIDLIFIELAIHTVKWLIFRLPVDAVTFAENEFLGEAIVDWLGSLFSFGILALIEPLLLCTVGTTLGKWIFGLKVRNRDGSKLSYLRGLRRMGSILVGGCGWFIPIFGWWRLWKSYQACNHNEIMPWDDDLLYETEERKLCGLYFILSLAAYFGLFLLVIFQTYVPVHQGALTKEEFIENCNAYIAQHETISDYHLDGNGVWIKEQSNEDTFVFTIGDDSSSYVPYEMTINDEGIVTAVRVEFEKTGQDEIRSPEYRTMHILTMSYLLANNRVNAFTFPFQDAIHREMSGFSNYSYTDGCVRVTNMVEKSGYRHWNGESGWLIGKDDEEQYFHWVFTMERTE